MELSIILFFCPQRTVTEAFVCSGWFYIRSMDFHEGSPKILSYSTIILFGRRDSLMIIGFNICYFGAHLPFIEICFADNINWIVTSCMSGQKSSVELAHLQNGYIVKIICL